MHHCGRLFTVSRTACIKENGKSPIYMQSIAWLITNYQTKRPGTARTYWNVRRKIQLTLGRNKRPQIYPALKKLTRTLQLRAIFHHKSGCIDAWQVLTALLFQFKRSTIFVTSKDRCDSYHAFWGFFKSLYTTLQYPFALFWKPSNFSQSYHLWLCHGYSQFLKV